MKTDWPLHKPSALEDLKTEAIRKDQWRLEGNYVRKGPFPPPAPDLSIRELSREDDGAGKTYLNLVPLHCDTLVYETGEAEPTTASSPVPTPARFEARGLQYKFLAYDSANPERRSDVKTWKPDLRLKKQLHNRGDHYEVELLAFPRANGVTIHYTTDGSSPIGSHAAIYAGRIQVPANCRKVCAVAQAPAFSLTSSSIVLDIPKRGEEGRSIDPTMPARWQQATKLDDAGAVWELIGRLETAADVVAYDINITAESANGEQNVDYSGALKDGYGAADLKAVAEKLQEIVNDGSLRMLIGELGFPTGQALIDWLKAAQKPFDPSYVSQG